MMIPESTKNNKQKRKLTFSNTRAEQPYNEFRGQNTRRGGGDVIILGIATLTQGGSEGQKWEMTTTNHSL
jgi:hypothetical protein